MMPMESKRGFRLTEVAPHSFDMPSGFYRTSMATVMNQDSFDRLSQQDQAALGKLFGEELSRISGAFWDDFDAAGLAALNNAGDNTLIMASEADQAVWHKKAEKIINQVISDISDTGIDGRAAYDYFRGEFETLKAGQ
jgi:TRAP-type C4-dicarboxylate transport system substrate-binding protein